MKFNININQQALAESPLDLSDCAILDWLIVYCNSANHKIDAMRIEGWTWIDYGQLLADMPLLRIKSKGALTPRVKRITDTGYIDTKLMNGDKMYVKLTSKIDELFMSTVHETKRKRSPKETLPFTKLNATVHETEPTIILDTNTKQIATAVATAPAFEWDKYLDTMKESKRKDINIIAFYLATRKKGFNNKQEVETAIRRHLKDAKALLAFDKPTIGECIRKLNYEFPAFTLKTVLLNLTK